MKHNWIPVANKRQRPTSGETIWLGSMKHQAVYMGYYSESMECFFDMQGRGIGCSHWMPIENPEPPKHDLQSWNQKEGV